ncbi:MAG TPA: NAD-dependent epimerase/dehydratase family protein, partial [Rubrivivax sp.]|nr:NAD-dependent epimerase/dehydratase family protein [Rubrivivax sp.]
MFDGGFPADGPAGRRHVLVTGGTGFVGHSLVPALADQGFRVTVLSRRAKLPAALQHAHVCGVRSLADVPSSDAVDAVI